MHTIIPEPADKWPADEACTLNTAFGTKQGLEDQHALGGASLFVPDYVGALTAKGPEGLGAPEVDGNHYIVSSGQANASITRDETPALDCLHEAPILGQPVYAQELADPLTANEQNTYTHEGKNNFRTRNVTAIAFKPGQSEAAGGFMPTVEFTPTLQATNNGSTAVPAVAFKPSHYTRGKDGKPSETVPPLSADADKGDQDPVVFETRYARNGRGAPDDVVPPLKARSGETGKGDAAPIVMHETGPGWWNEGQQAGTIRAEGENRPSRPSNVVFAQGVPTPSAMIVRRLTPTECERLQGFPDGYTDIPGASDSARYKALGNSMAVPVMRWIGERIERMPRTSRPEP
jgi:DNA (cytosine-5)-methyltransferase 1